MENPITYPLFWNTCESSELMTVPELAEYLGIGKNKTYDMLRKGIIKGFHIGTTWKISREAVDYYIRKSSGLA